MTGTAELYIQLYILVHLLVGCMLRGVRQLVSWSEITPFSLGPSSGARLKYGAAGNSSCVYVLQTSQAFMILIYC